MVKEMDPIEQVQFLEEENKRIQRELKNAKKLAAETAKERKVSRIQFAGSQLEKLVQDGGYPEWELSCPFKGSRWSKSLEDTTDAAAKAIINMLKKHESQDSDPSFQKILNTIEEPKNTSAENNSEEK